MRVSQTYLLSVMLACQLAACGGGGGGSSSTDGPPASGSPDGGGTSSASDPAAELRMAAARDTANQNALCRAVSPFYYEIGDRNGVLASGTLGGTRYTANTMMPIASASKWLFGAYVAEVKAGQLDQSDVRATHMLSGYASMSNACGTGSTVASCFAASGNDAYTPAKLDRYNYDSGHFQKWAVDHGMGAMTGDDVAEAYQSRLGITTRFNGPLLAGGAITTPASYTAFLRRVLNRQLRIADLLGSAPTCTQPASCPTADYSPLTAEAWHYSVGHWVEDDPQTGDGSFSSAGAFGFYPWIDRSRSWYGVLARADTSGDNQGYASAQCGRLIRKAWLSGVVQ